MVTRTGTAANNNFNIVDPGVYIIDGLGGVDTVDFGTEPSFSTSSRRALTAPSMWTPYPVPALPSLPL